MYDLNDWRCIAREIARSGGHIARAAFYLRTHYEGFDSIRHRTIRRLFKKSFVQALHGQQEQMLDKVMLEGEAEVEKARAKVQATSKSPVRQTVAETARRIGDAVKEGRDPKALQVLLDYLQFQNRI